jgi:hypothetical protein
LSTSINQQGDPIIYSHAIRQGPAGDGGRKGRFTLWLTVIVRTTTTGYQSDAGNSLQALARCI